jgi:hypothetical protein
MHNQWDGVSVPMNDMVLVTVVDAREHLFHENSCIFLSELASSDDLIEELTTFAYSTDYYNKEEGYSVTM